MERPIPALSLLLISAALVPSGLQAEHTRFWREADYASFEKGTARGVALRSDGKLFPAPRSIQFADPGVAYLWALQLDSRGNLYAAGGSNAKVLRFDPKGHADVIFESKELAAQALAMDKHDNLYVGTAPDGKVYKITPSGEKSVFFEPKAKYIWAMVIAPTGEFYIATGDQGEVFAVTPEGKCELFVKSEEHHIRSLAFDSRGNLLLGTEPNGMIIRVNVLPGSAGSPPKAGSVFVLHQTSGKEVTSIVTAPNGSIYATALGLGDSSSATGPVENVQARTAAGAFGQVSSSASFLPTATGSIAYRITTDGLAQELWTSHDELVYSSELSPEGRLLLALGNQGIVVQLENNGEFMIFANTHSAQVTGLLVGAGGKLFVCTANPGKVFVLGPDADPESTFESDVFDAKIPSHWGRVTWHVEKGSPENTVNFYVRCGNTSHAEKNWTAWTGPYTNAETVNCPLARFAQWKAVFRSQSVGLPSISWVRLAYLPRNIAPVIDGVVIQDSNAQSVGASPSTTLLGGGGESAPASLPSASPFGHSQVVSNSAPPVVDMSQGVLQKGYRSVAWSAHDNNGDNLVFSVYYRAEGEENWKLLKGNLTQKSYTWDTAAMPDGAYYLKVVASDALSNPPSDALTSERISERFEVDNTPPVIDRPQVTNLLTGGRVRFTAHDSHTLSHAEFSLDSGEWTPVFPVDLLTDSSKEDYEILLPRLDPGEHSVRIRIYDDFQNVSAAEAVFKTTTDTKRPATTKASESGVH